MENSLRKPHYWSYMLFSKHLLASMVVLGVILPVLVLIFSMSSSEMVWAWVFIPVILVFLAVRFLWAHICYKKEIYEFFPEKIVRHSGTIFSDNTTDINLQKVTHVNVVLPFFQYLFVKTGNIYIHTAGSSTSKAMLLGVKNPLEKYEEIQLLLQKNGYHMKRDTLVQEASPHILGIFEELLSKGAGMIFFILYIAFGIASSARNYEGNAAIEMTEYAWIFYFASILFLLGIIGYVVCIYLDLKRRKYQVFTDSVFYTEGFLTKNYAFLPMERVADIENKQSFFSRIFGLHDIIISSEWTGNSVTFKNMTDGEQMIKNIKFLKNEITRLPVEFQQSGPENMGENATKSTPLIHYTDTIQAPIEYNRDFRATYKMNPVKVLFTSILSIIVAIIFAIFWGWDIFGVIVILIILSNLRSIIALFFTDYIIDTASVEKKFHFLSKKHASLTVDKVSSVSIEQSLLDRLLGTCTLVFYTIGGASMVRFADMTKTPDLEKNILEKVGIYTEKSTPKPAVIRFNFIKFIKNSIGGFIFLSLLLVFAGVTVVLLPIVNPEMQAVAAVFSELSAYVVLGIFALIGLVFLYQKYLYSPRFYQQNFYTDMVESISGIIWKKKKYARYRHIKSVQSKKNPLTDVGSMTLSVAGSGMMVSTENNKNNTPGWLNSVISLKYVDNVFAVADSFDTVLQGREIDTNQIFEAPQDVRNTLVPEIIFLVIMVFGLYNGLGIEVAIFGAIVLLAMLALTVWYISTKKYTIQADRVISQYGIIYKTRESILFSRFNFTEKHQGFFGKIFRNGVVHIYTIGSNSRDMTCSDVSEYSAMYDILKNRKK